MWSVVAPHGAAALLALTVASTGAVGCLSGEVDGTWRHPLDSEPAAGPAYEPAAGPAYELALGQYGPEVAGLVRVFRASTPGGDAYARPLYCRPLIGGEVTGDVLRFQFRDPDGVGFSASLEVGDDRLTGWVESDDDRLNPMAFERIDSGVDKDCEGRTEPFAMHGIVQGDGLPESLRIGLFYTGVEESGRFWVPRNIVSLDPEAPSFSIEIHRQPDPKMLSVALTDGSLRFAYALFVAFDDRDGDGAWDREVLGNDAAEPLVGVAPDHALVYLEGRATSVYPDRPELLEELAQNYNLVTVVRRGAGGEVISLLPADPATESVRVHVPAGRGTEPFLVHD